MSEPRVHEHPNLAIEEAVIGAMLAGDQGFVDECIIKLRPIDFEHPTLREIFQIARDLRIEFDHPVTTLTIRRYAHENRKRVDLDKLISLEDSVPMQLWADPEAASVYFKMLKEAGNSVLAREVVEQFRQGKIDKLTLVDEIQRIDSEDGHDQPLHTSLAEEVANFRRNPGEPVIRLGFGDLDNIVRVYQGNMICFAGDTSMGKSTLAIQASLNVASSRPVLFASIEMVARELVSRMMKIRTGSLDTSIADPDGAPAQRDRIIGQFDYLSSLPIEIMDVTRCDPMSIHKAALSVQKRYGDLGLIVIDYIQRMPWPSGTRNEFEAASRNSTSCKDLAMETKIPTLVVSQLSREHQREQRLPQLQDLRNSGRISEDADTVIMIGVTCKNKDDDPREATTRQLLVRKQRNGPTGKVIAEFNRQTVSYENFRTAEY